MEGMRPGEGLNAPVLTVGDFLARAEAHGVKASTVLTYRRELDAMERWAAAGVKGRESVPLLEASARNLMALSKRLHGMKSGRHYAALLRMFFRAARRPDLVEAFESRNWQRARRLRSDELLMLEDVNALLARGADTVRDRALIATLWATGARIHEVLALDLRHVESNPEGTVFALDLHKTKVQGEERKAYVTKRDGASFLAAWVAVHPDKRAIVPLFPAARGGTYARMTRSAARALLLRAAQRAGLTKKVFPHLFRHSRATHLLRLGLSEANVKALVGWVPGSAMLNRYAHLTGKDAHRAYLEVLGESPKADPAEAFGEIVAPDTLGAVVPMRAAPAAIPPPSEASAANGALAPFGSGADLELKALLRAALERPEIAKALLELAHR